MQFKQVELSNGLTILGEISDTAASMATGFFVRTGSRDESADIAGVSHFLEHMMFKGTQRRSPFDINREFDEMGAIYNAFTSEENTVYYAAVLPEFQARAVDLLGDMMRPALRDEDFQTEKGVILEEIALYEDRPQFRLYEKLMADHFGQHPLGNSILGTVESIKALKRKNMLTYFDRRYSPSNVTLIGVGKLDWDTFVAKAKEVCDHWEPHEVSRDTPDSAGTQTSNVIADEKLLRQHIGLMSRAPSAQDSRRYTAGMFATILGDATGSRLFYALVEPAIAEEASVHYSELDGTGAFLTFISSDPDRATQALEIAREEFARFAEEGPTDAEVEAAKNKTACSVTLKGELPMGRLTAVGFDWVYRGQYVPLAEHVEKILAVSKQEIHELASSYDMSAATVLGLGPIRSLAP